MEHITYNIKKVGIILVGYKDYVNRFLDECRDSLRAQNYPKELFQVYIIDNCSINDCEYVKSNYPEARCAVRLDGNYAVANNLGIKLAREDGCEYFVIANMDVKFDPNWLLELVKAIESDSEIGIAQSKILKYPQNDEEWKNPKINSLGNIIHFLGFGFTRGYDEVEEEYNKISSVISGLNMGDNPQIPPAPFVKGGDFNPHIPPLEGGAYTEIKGYASGCSFIIKKEVIDKIGGYNEEYYMYHDDLELGWRARLAGYKIILAPKSIVYHKYEFSRSVRMLYYMERNRHLAIFSYYRLPTIILILPALLIMDLGMLFYSIVNGWLFTKLKICFYFLNPAVWFKIFKTRKEIKKLRVKKDREIIKDFSGEIKFQEIANPVLKYVVNPALNIYWAVVKRLIFW
jgi:hypothetical protein